MQYNLIIKDHPAGFFSNFNKAIQLLAHYDKQVGKITWNMTNNLFYQYNSGEIFSKLFQDYTSGSDVLEDLILEKYNDYTYTAHTVADVYRREDQSWRTKYYYAFEQFVHFSDFTSKVWSDVYRSFLKEDRPVVGILIRNNILGTEQPNSKLPTLEQYVSAINNLQLDNPLIFCAIDNKQSLDYISSKFETCFNPYVTRSSTPNDHEPHSKPDMTLTDAAFHFLEGYMLSNCDHLIHPVSNMATAALYMNPSLKNTFLIG